MREVQIRKDSQWTMISAPYADATAKVLDAREVDGVEYVTYLRSDKYAGRSVRTLRRESFLGAYEKKSDFFRVDRAYKYSWTGSDGTTYHIQELYQVSKPLFPSDRWTARAVAIGSNDKRQMVMLNKDDFGSMVEVTP